MMIRLLTFLLLLVLCYSFHMIRSKVRYTTYPSCQLATHGKSVLFSHSSQSPAFVSASTALYRSHSQGSQQQSIINKVIARVTDVASGLNPMQILGGIYVVFMVGMLATGVLSRTKLLVNLVRGNREETLQLYECEFCGMEMRPARGRALQILSKRGFRCAQCGAPGSAFFDTENLGDPRAVARLHRLRKEKRKEQKALYEESDNLENEDDFEDD